MSPRGLRLRKLGVLVWLVRRPAAPSTLTFRAQGSVRSRQPPQGAGWDRHQEDQR